MYIYVFFLQTYFYWRETVFCCLDYSVHSMGHRESMRPVVVRNIAVVLLDCHSETYHIIQVISETKQIPTLIKYAVKIKIKVILNIKYAVKVKI